MTLFDGEGRNWNSRSIDARFREFHAKHPEVYRELRRRALDLVQRGHRKHLGIGMLWEVLRYFTMLGSDPSEHESYRLNDHYRSRYARLLMEQEPELEGIFETRELKS